MALLIFGGDKFIYLLRSLARKCGGRHFRQCACTEIGGNISCTQASALAFMVFVLLYFPCIATLAAVSRETGSWKYTLFTLLYNTGI